MKPLVLDEVARQALREMGVFHPHTREMNRNDSATNKFTCETEDQARKKIAEIGRPVCGTCVSTLYTTKQSVKR